MRTIVLVYSDDLTGCFYMGTYQVPDNYVISPEIASEIRATPWCDEVQKIMESIGGQRVDVEEWCV